MKFTAADVHCLNAAEGWLDLGNHLEADKELDEITPQLRAHPIVLQMEGLRFGQEVGHVRRDCLHVDPNDAG